MLGKGQIVALEGQCCRFRFFPKVQSLTVPQKIDQFGRKRCKKKRKDVSYQLIIQNFQNIVLHISGGLSKINSVHTYELKGFILVASTVYSGISLLPDISYSLKNDENNI